ncbi:hypothetical protein BDQ94DRAFT_164191 [Aspergillus welwitschiae]|uniref:Uncharacterized protein n=1 Tax=Aspergillus welwitschiae TaxID=1341132 RepID=A0A3F3PJ65_9EURO|nr:hypothetical protein BDQ94DRAFT_164191 [Aspergillus welwitschiae]RDH26782.1 hypothetical protein BDQ94DRAFT_164191 [Aspergillus welwitschiae]
MHGTSPPQYQWLQALRTTLGLQTSHPVQIGANSHTAVAKGHGITEHGYLNSAVVDQSSRSPNPLAVNSDGDCGQGQAFALLNEHMYDPVLSTRLTQISASESSMREQKQWNQDLGRPWTRLKWSSVPTRGKDTSS